MNSIFVLQVTVFCLFQVVSSDKLFSDDSSILIEDPKNVAIDFSNAIPGPDGTVCVQRKKYVDKKEKERNQYNYVTEILNCFGYHCKKSL